MLISTGAGRTAKTPRVSAPVGDCRCSGELIEAAALSFTATSSPGEDALNDLVCRSPAMPSLSPFPARPTRSRIEPEVLLPPADSTRGFVVSSVGLLAGVPPWCRAAAVSIGSDWAGRNNREASADKSATGRLGSWAFALGSSRPCNEPPRANTAEPRRDGEATAAELRDSGRLKDVGADKAGSQRYEMASGNRRRRASSFRLADLPAGSSSVAIHICIMTILRVPGLAHIIVDVCFTHSLQRACLTSKELARNVVCGCC